MQEVCTPNNDLTPACVYDQQDILISFWVGGWATKICACSRSRRAEEEKGTVRTVPCLLGSCLPLGWTLVPFRLWLEWHLANPASSITEPRPRVRGWAGLSEAQLGRGAN